jgi:NAD(P)-dependent dehydrogenase (short-subunit alcohol dehydrogenase family)
VLTVRGDITDPGTAKRVVEAALHAFGRVDSFVNDAEMSIEEPFTDYGADASTESQR